MTTIDLLQQIGLNKYEAEAYYTLITHGSLTGYEVGKYSHVPGSRSYEILERLLEKGLALVQPGDPPRYTAQDPHAVVDRFRSTMETTLDALAMSFVSLAHTDRAGEFWIVRGQQNVLAQARTIIEHAQLSLEFVLPAHYDVAECVAHATARGCRIFRARTEDQDSSVILLVRDGQEAFVGTVTPADSCQAVVSANRALLDALHGYFLYRQSSPRAISEMLPVPSQPHEVAWMDWEAHKQQQLRNASSGNRVA